MIAAESGMEDAARLSPREIGKGNRKNTELVSDTFLTPGSSRQICWRRPLAHLARVPERPASAKRPERSGRQTVDLTLRNPLVAIRYVDMKTISRVCDVILATVMLCLACERVDAWES